MTRTLAFILGAMVLYAGSADPADFAVRGVPDPPAVFYEHLPWVGEALDEKPTDSQRVPVEDGAVHETASIS